MSVALVRRRPLKDLFARRSALVHRYVVARSRGRLGWRSEMSAEDRDEPEVELLFAPRHFFSGCVSPVLGLGGAPEVLTQGDDQRGEPLVTRHKLAPHVVGQIEQQRAGHERAAALGVFEDLSQGGRVLTFSIGAHGALTLSDCLPDCLLPGAGTLLSRQRAKRPGGSPNGLAKAHDQLHGKGDGNGLHHCPYGHK